MKYSYDEFFQERTKLCYFELWQKLLQCEREAMKDLAWLAMSALRPTVPRR